MFFLPIPSARVSEKPMAWKSWISALHYTAPAKTNLAKRPANRATRQTQHLCPKSELCHPHLIYVLTTVGTKIIADPEKCFQELIFEKLLIFLRDGSCLELIIVSSNFQTLLLLQDKLLESV